MKDNKLLRLTEKAKDGDNEAFENIINEIKQELYKIAILRLKNEDDVADVIQNTVLNAYENIKKLKQPQHFKTWIIKILINECNKMYNSNIRFVERQGVINSEEKKYYNLENESELSFESIIKILEKEEKNVFVLYYSCDLTVKEIAQVLDKNFNTIKSILHRGKKKIKSQMEVI